MFKKKTLTIVLALTLSSAAMAATNPASNSATPSQIPAVIITDNSMFGDSHPPLASKYAIYNEINDTNLLGSDKTTFPTEAVIFEKNIKVTDWHPIVGMQTHDGVIDTLDTAVMNDGTPLKVSDTSSITVFSTNESEEPSETIGAVGYFVKNGTLTNLPTVATATAKHAIGIQMVNDESVTRHYGASVKGNGHFLTKISESTDASADKDKTSDIASILKFEPINNENLQADEFARGLDILQTGGTFTGHFKKLEVAGATEGLQAFSTDNGSIDLTVDDFRANGRTAIKLLSNRTKNKLHLTGSSDVGGQFKANKKDEIPSVQAGANIYGMAAFVAGQGSELVIDSSADKANHWRGQLVADHQGEIHLNYVQGREIITTVEPIDLNDVGAEAAFASSGKKPFAETYASVNEKLTFKSGDQKLTLADILKNNKSVKIQATSSDGKDFVKTSEFSVSAARINATTQNLDMQKEWANYVAFVEKAYAELPETISEKEREDASEHIRNVRTMMPGALEPFLKKIYEKTIKVQAPLAENASLLDENDYRAIKTTAKNDIQLPPFMNQAIELKRSMLEATKALGENPLALENKREKKEEVVGAFNSDLMAYRGAHIQAQITGLNSEAPIATMTMKDQGVKFYSRRILAKGEGAVSDVSLNQSDFLGIVNASEQGKVNLSVSKGYSNAPLMAFKKGQIIATFNDAVFEGIADKKDDEQDTKINVTLNNSTWNVSRSQHLDDLTLMHAQLKAADSMLTPNLFDDFRVDPGQVPFVEMHLDGALVSDQSSVITLRIDSSKDNTSGDKLYVASLEGAPKLKIIDQAKESNKANIIGHELIFVKEGSSHGFVKPFKSEGLLKNRLYHLGFEETSTLEGFGAWKITDQVNEVDSDLVNANMSANRALYQIWRGDMLSLEERMGADLLQAGEKERVWVRTSQQGFKAGDEYGFNVRVNSLALGHTLSVKRLANETRYRGLTLEGKRMAADYVNYIKRTDGYGLGAYQTDVFDNQVYVDTVLRVNRWHSGASVDVQGLTYSPTYNAWGVSLSAEVGKRFDLGANWFVQPSTQWMVGFLQGKDWANEDVTVSQKSIRSVIGRVGVSFGRESGDKRQRVYAKVNAFHNLAGRSIVEFDNGDDAIEKRTRRDETWVNIGAGASTMLGKRTQVFADAQATVSGNARQQYGVNIGVKWLLH